MQSFISLLTSLEEKGYQQAEQEEKIAPNHALKILIGYRGIHILNGCSRFSTDGVDREQNYNNVPCF